jgi:predicted  nucleic acid-binding Zn-ribbon protein
MNDLLQNLIKLQALKFGEVQDKNVEAAMAELRVKIPTQILAHFDRLVARGKKGVAIVRNQVCTSCHMSVPIGVIVTLRQGQDIQLCESCGRYLYLPPDWDSKAAEPAVAPKPGKKTRKPKKPVQVI